MKWIPRFVMMTIVAAAVAVGLSYVMKLDESAGVFRTEKPVNVSESNIVDVVAKMPLHLRIRRVEVSHSIVSIDLLAVKSTASADLMQDLYEIPRTMFSASNNVNQVLVRVLDGSITQGSPQLLVATDARRDKWLAGEPRIVPRGAEEIQSYLDSHYRMTYTPKWQERVFQKS